MRLATLGRLVAIVGIVTAFLAIWLHVLEAAFGEASLGFSYWDLDGTLGGALLALACAGALLALAALVVDRAAVDVALAAVGAVFLGLYLFFPAGAVFTEWATLGSGAWLGACTALVVLGGCLAAAASLRGRSLSGAATPMLGLAATGWSLVLAGIWLHAERRGDNYWHPEGGGHGLGALFVILLVAWALLAALGLAGRSNPALVAATGVAFTALGLAAFLPVIEAFDGWDRLRAGAWLPFAGGIVLSGATVLATRASEPSGG